MAKFAWGALFGAALVWSAFSISSMGDPAPGLPPCATDEAEGPDCHWDAAHQGNGQGKSFDRIDGIVYYTD